MSPTTRSTDGLLYRGGCGLYRDGHATETDGGLSEEKFSMPKIPFYMEKNFVIVALLRENL